MSKNIIFISDFYYPEFTGGAELNDYSLISRLVLDAKVEVWRKKCCNVDISFMKENKDANFIISNFVTLSEECKNYLKDHCKYIIYEHDHKYLKKRNPIFYVDFHAPKEELSDFYFYKYAKAVICLTQIAVDVFKKNTGLSNVVKIGASVWRDSDLQYINDIRKDQKKKCYAIMDNDNPIKKKFECVEYCKKNGINYELIKDKDNKEFLKKLNEYEGLVFMTGHLETCCRIVVEAKMLGLKVITQKKLIGAASEDWYSLSGEELVSKMQNISNKSVNVFLDTFCEKPKKMCVVSTGCVRPSAERVYNNIISTIEKIKSYEYDFYILTYDTDDAYELKNMLVKNNINVKFFTIPFIKEAIGNGTGNGFRMFKKNEILIEKINNFSDFDIILRHRLDTEIEEIEIPHHLEQNTYYTPLRSWGNPYDHVGITTPSLYRSIWTTKNQNFYVREPEQILKDSINRNKIEVKPFNFKINLYQSNEKMFLNVPQWSKRSRTWEYKNVWINEGSDL